MWTQACFSSWLLLLFMWTLTWFCFFHMHVFCLNVCWKCQMWSVYGISFLFSYLMLCSCLILFLLVTCCCCCNSSFPTGIIKAAQLHKLPQIVVRNMFENFFFNNPALEKKCTVNQIHLYVIRHISPLVRFSSCIKPSQDRDLKFGPIYTTKCKFVTVISGVV